MNTELFYSPFQTALVKAEEENGNWIVYLEASNEITDSQDDITLQKALKEASDYFAKHGVLSWDHKHKELNDPKYIIGEPKDVAFKNDTRRSTLIKGQLYKASEIAQSVWALAQSNSSRLGASIGGYILKRDPRSTGTINNVFWDETAITHKPINSTTQGRVSVVPFEEFAKALMAGQGVNAQAFTGGRALTGSNLSDVLARQNPNIGVLADDQKLQRLFDDLMIRIRGGLITDLNDVVAMLIANGITGDNAIKVTELLDSKLKSLLEETNV